MSDTTTEEERLEALAPHYDAGADFDRHMLGAFASVLKRRVAGAHVLDLGCSTGTTSQAIADVVGSLDLVDGSATYIKAARQRVHGRHVRFFASLFENFVPDRLYDHIICSHVMEHVAEPIETLSRMKSWLAPSGRIWVYVPNARSLHRLLGVKMGLCASVYDLSERDHRIGHRRVYDGDALSHHIRAAGLSHSELRGVLIKPLPNALMEKLGGRVIQGLLDLGADYPEISSDIFFECFVPECRP
ncbi:MAG: class I SAM-dependent methyltransferase [Candidatus Tyrphobacter sp.]